MTKTSLPLPGLPAAAWQDFHIHCKISLNRRALAIVLYWVVRVLQSLDFGISIRLSTRIHSRPM